MENERAKAMAKTIAAKRLELATGDYRTNLGEKLELDNPFAMSKLANDETDCRLCVTRAGIGATTFAILDAIASSICGLRVAILKLDNRRAEMFARDQLRRTIISSPTSNSEFSPPETPFHCSSVLSIAGVNGRIQVIPANVRSSYLASRFDKLIVDELETFSECSEVIDELTSFMLASPFALKSLYF